MKSWENRGEMMGFHGFPIEFRREQQQLEASSTLLRVLNATLSVLGPFKCGEPIRIYDYMNHRISK
jgi:hypothetical protein